MWLEGLFAEQTMILLRYLATKSTFCQIFGGFYVPKLQTEKMLCDHYVIRFSSPSNITPNRPVGIIRQFESLYSCLWINVTFLSVQAEISTTKSKCNSSIYSPNFLLKSFWRHCCTYLSKTNCESSITSALEQHQVCTLLLTFATCLPSKEVWKCYLL